MSALGEFQPADKPEPDYDALWESWFAEKERGGYAVLSRDEWKEKLDSAARDGYAEGRSDEREECAGLLVDLREAAATLRRYESLHLAKGTEESFIKAAANAALALRFEMTIAKATGSAS